MILFKYEIKPGTFKKGHFVAMVWIIMIFYDASYDLLHDAFLHNSLLSVYALTV